MASDGQRVRGNMVKAHEALRSGVKVRRNGDARQQSQTMWKPPADGQRQVHASSPGADVHWRHGRVANGQPVRRSISRFPRLNRLDSEAKLVDQKAVIIAASSGHDRLLRATIWAMSAR